MRKLLVTAIVGGMFWMGGVSLQTSVARADSPYVDYAGKNLFLGLAYHRYGCLDNGPTLTSNNTYQGFTANQYCSNGQDFNSWVNAQDTYLGWNYASSDAWMGYYYGNSNWSYGLRLAGTSNASDYHSYAHSWQTNYSNNDTFGMNSRGAGGEPNNCSYNVLTNCNSDCWMRDFSTRQGGTASPKASSVSIASPCW